MLQDCKCKPLPFDFAIGPDGLDHAGRRGGVVVEVVHVVVHIQRRHRHGALRRSFANRQRNVKMRVIYLTLAAETIFVNDKVARVLRIQTFN